MLVDRLNVNEDKIEEHEVRVQRYIHRTTKHTSASKDFCTKLKAASISWLSSLCTHFVDISFACQFLWSSHKKESNQWWTWGKRSECNRKNGAISGHQVHTGRKNQMTTPARSENFVSRDLRSATVHWPTLTVQCRSKNPIMLTGLLCSAIRFGLVGSLVWEKAYPSASQLRLSRGICNSLEHEIAIAVENRETGVHIIPRAIPWYSDRTQVWIHPSPISGPNPA